MNKIVKSDGKTYEYEYLYTRITDKSFSVPQQQKINKLINVVLKYEPTISREKAFQKVIFSIIKKGFILNEEELRLLL